MCKLVEMKQTVQGGGILGHPTVTVGHKLVAGLFGSLLMFFGTAPQTTHTLAIVCAVLIAVDTLTGVMASVVMRDLQSTKMRTKLVAKTTQYMILSTFGLTLTILVQSWFFTSAVLGAICGIEALSMLENLVRLQIFGGVKLGPASKFLDFVSDYFGSIQGGDRVVTTATVIPPSSKENDAPIISTTTIETMQRPTAKQREDAKMTVEDE